MSPLLPPGGHDPSEVSLHAMTPQRFLLLHTLMRLAVMISWCYGLGSVQLCAAYGTKNSGISNTQMQCQQHLCQDMGGSSSSSWRTRPGPPLSPAMALKWHLATGDIGWCPTVATVSHKLHELVRWNSPTNPLRPGTPCGRVASHTSSLFKAQWAGSSFLGWFYYLYFS